MLFHTTYGETITIEPGTVLIIGWSAENGDRGAGAVHYTETVLAIALDAIVLGGGKYRHGAKTRTLRLRTKKGAATSQIRGVATPAPPPAPMRDSRGRFAAGNPWRFR